MLTSKDHVHGGGPEGGDEAVTTIMLRRLPSTLTTDTLVAMLQVFAPGQFDFVYMPHDRKRGTHISLAFINFVDSASASWAQHELQLLKKHAGWDLVTSASSVQGLTFNLAYFVARFGRRAINDSYAPLLFKHGVQLGESEVRRTYAGLPSCVLLEAQRFLQAEKAGSMAKGTSRRAFPLIWVPNSSKPWNGSWLDEVVDEHMMRTRCKDGIHPVSFIRPTDGALVFNL
mmetsp:Transcript_63750/g.149734  ORF Transcript_63750/g.149734 Transcript_63750/m.149734 type:complete len:229 (-) Transcript_63750:209-895(-)